MSDQIGQNVEASVRERENERERERERTRERQRERERSGRNLAQIEEGPARSRHHREGYLGYLGERLKGTQRQGEGKWSGKYKKFFDHYCMQLILTTTPAVWRFSI